MHFTWPETDPAVRNTNIEAFKEDPASMVSAYELYRYFSPEKLAEILN